MARVAMLLVQLCGCRYVRPRVADWKRGGFKDENMDYVDEGAGEEGCVFCRVPLLRVCGRAQRRVCGGCAQRGGRAEGCAAVQHRDVCVGCG